MEFNYKQFIADMKTHYVVYATNEYRLCKRGDEYVLQQQWVEEKGTNIRNYWEDVPTYIDYEDDRR